MPWHSCFVSCLADHFRSHDRCHCSLLVVDWLPVARFPQPDFLSGSSAFTRMQKLQLRVTSTWILRTVKANFLWEVRDEPALYSRSDFVPERRASEPLLKYWGAAFEEDQQCNWPADHRPTKCSRVTVQHQISLNPCSLYKYLWSDTSTSYTYHNKKALYLTTNCTTPIVIYSFPPSETSSIVSWNEPSSTSLCSPYTIRQQSSAQAALLYSPPKVAVLSIARGIYILHRLGRVPDERNVRECAISSF